MSNEWIAAALKQMPCVELPGGMLRSCPVRLSYPYLFEPQAGQAQDDGSMGKPKYATTLLFPRGADLTVLKAAANKAAIDKFGANYKGPRLHTPFRDQGEKGHINGYEEGCIFISASSLQRPGVVDAQRQQIHDPARVYPGVWALVSLRPYAFDNPKKKGVSFGLGNVQIIRDDEPFSVRSAPDDDFQAVNIDGQIDTAALF
ncbi:DUF2815 family protein [Hyphomicrobium sp. DY-1]|uniref:DUF2815 family protein n=1 Tax=Hyphomicrobium sp. DY-1 TaxID=3075650 RepID=UPI0039C3221C